MNDNIHYLLTLVLDRNRDTRYKIIADTGRKQIDADLVGSHMDNIHGKARAGMSNWRTAISSFVALENPEGPMVSSQSGQNYM